MLVKMVGFSSRFCFNRFFFFSKQQQLRHWMDGMGPFLMIRRQRYHCTSIILSDPNLKDIPTSPVNELKMIRQLPQLHHLSFEEEVNYMDRQFTNALRPFYNQQVPVIFRKSALHFPAIQKWKDLSYLETQLADWQDCQAEMGLYNQKDAEKMRIPFTSYAQYLRLAKQEEENDAVDPDEPTDEHLEIYLAQNELPAVLEKDICIPSVCTGIHHDDAAEVHNESKQRMIGHGRLYQRNLWIGPANVTSPLHFDPLDNFIVQIVGRKRVFLLDKSVDPDRLYAGEVHGQQSNTSAVPVYNGKFDATKYPKFQNVLDHPNQNVLSSELNAGDVLFVPSKWWHALVALEYSISVNIWWR
jgi:hypothetical protein